MNMRTLILPIPPNLNSLYPTGHHGKRHLSDAGRRYHETAALIALSAGVRRLDGDVAANLSIYRPRKIGDLDGFFKVVFDAMTGIAYRDDRQISEIHAYRFDDKDNPRAELQIGLAINQPFR